MSRIARRPPSVWPPITDGLTFYAPMTRDFGMVPVHSAAGTTGLSTETVDADGTYTEDFSNLIVDAVVNTARVGVNGVLSEIASTNIIPEADNIAAAGGWTLSNATSAKNATGPNGVASDAWTLTDASASLGRAYDQLLVADDSTLWTGSVWVKKVSATPTVFPCIRLTLTGGTAVEGYCYLNPQTGAVGTVGGETATAQSAVEKIPGWWKLQITITNNGTGNVNLFIDLRPSAVTAAAPTVQSNASQGSAVMWMPQVENQAAATSTIPTAAAAVTRAKEDLDFPGSDLAWAAGSALIAVTPDQLHGVVQSILDIYTDADNRISLTLDAAGKPNLYINDGGAEQADLTATDALVAGTTYVIGIAWAGNDARLYVNAADEQADAGVVAPAGAITLFVGQSGANATQFNGALSNLLTYDRALTAAEFEDNQNGHYSKREIV